MSEKGFFYCFLIASFIVGVTLGALCAVASYRDRDFYYCPKCQTVSEEDTRYCDICGTEMQKVHTKKNN